MIPVWRGTTPRVEALVLAIALSASGESATPAAGGSPDLQEEAAAKRLFTLKVLPLLKERCQGCHGDDPDALKGQLDLRSREALLRGGESDRPALVPGEPGESTSSSRSSVEK